MKKLWRRFTFACSMFVVAWRQGPPERAALNITRDPKDIMKALQGRPPHPTPFRPTLTYDDFRVDRVDLRPPRPPGSNGE